MNKRERMRELVEILNKAAKTYYQGKDELMSNLEYDALYDELVSLEQELQMTMSKSPTQKVGYEVVSELPKEHHISPMLSLDKTKSVEELKSFAGEHEALLSLKLDGLSVIVTYENGVITKALTRGNGEIGEVITNNAKTFVNLPARIPFKETIVIRGEALIHYSDFEKINLSLDASMEKYKNPRNLCSGSVRQLNNEITASRQVHYYVYNLIAKPDQLNFTTHEEEMNWLSNQGFDVVTYKKVSANTMEENVLWFSELVKTSDIPTDGLVLQYNNVAYGNSLGRTAKFPRHSIAFKWADEKQETTLKRIVWSASRTGLINPVAVFDPVELEGTTVTRASVHNVSILRQLKLGIGDRIEVYKANMIIPQIAQNITQSDSVEIPSECPVCGEETKLSEESQATVLVCTNPKCMAKRIKLLTHFVSRNAMNIDGLSEATLEKFVDYGFVHELSDIFKLSQYKDQLVKLEGFGEKSFNNLMSAIDEARNTTLDRVIYSLGIQGFGLANAKIICREFDDDLDRIRHASINDLTQIDGIGDVMGQALVDWFSLDENNEQLNHILNEVHIQKTVQSAPQSLTNLVFVITGSLNKFDNRDACREYIEQRGGKVTASVTKKTNYLINNDTTSSSTKNKKAKELGVKIIDEEEFLDLCNH